jgi:predicted membrane channel-forming protein YqfA (hemolysin III family)
MSRKGGISLSLFGAAFVTRQLFSTPAGSEILFILLPLLILYLSAAVYHFIKRKEPITSFPYSSHSFLISGVAAGITAFLLLIL